MPLNTDPGEVNDEPGEELPPVAEEPIYPGQPEIILPPDPNEPPVDDDEE